MTINANIAEAIPQEAMPVEINVSQIRPASAGINITRSVQPTDAQKEKENQPLSLDETKEIVAELTEYMNILQTNMRFSMSEKLNHQVIVEIKNKETDELIKQIPSEEILNLREKMEEITGLIFDAKI